MKHLLLYLAVFLAPTVPGTYRVIATHPNGVYSDTVRVTVVPPDTGWTVHYSFDDRALGSRLSGFFSGTTVTDEQSLVGAQSARVSIQEGTDGWGTWGGIVTFPKPVTRGQTVRARVAFWLPTDFVPNQRNGDRLKLMRMGTRGASDNHTGYLDMHYNVNALTNTNPYTWSYEGAGYTNYWRPWGIGHPIQQEQWEVLEWAITADDIPMSQGGMARVLIWKNGTLVADIRDARTLVNASGFIRNFLLYTYWNGDAQADFYHYIDELTVTTKIPTQTDSAGNPYLGPITPS